MNPAAGETDEAYRHFSETLEAELVANVKPVIMSLTMLAEDYSAHSAYIARAIEEYILKVRPELKILGLYLMDSIMKNLKQTTNYIKIFEKNIVSVFCRVFSAVDESQRRALYKLRQTWNVLFSNAALLDLDKSVQQLDPAWPITATTSSSSLPSSSSSSSTTANSRVQQQATTSVIKPVQQLQQQPQPQPQTQPQQQQQLKKVPTPTPIPSQTQPQPQQQKQPSIEPATQPSTVPTITTMMNKTTVAAPVVRDRDPRLIRAQQQQQQPSTATVIRSSGGGQISPPSTKSSESSTDLSIGGGGGVKPTQSSSMTAIGATQSTQSSPSKPASSALVNLKRTSTSDLHPKVEAKKPKMIVVSPPPDKDPTNQILPPPVKPPAASKTTSPKTGAKTAAAAKAKTTTSPSGKTTTTATKTSTKVPSVLDLELNPEEKPTAVAAPTKKVKNESVVKTVPAKQTTATTTTTVAQTVTPVSQTSTNNSKAAAIATLKNAAKLQALVSNTTTKPPNTAATTSTTGVKSMLKRLQNTDKILAAAAAAAASTQTQLQSNQNHTTSTTNHNHNNSHKTSVVDSKQSDDLLQPLSDVDERFGDVDERFIPPTSGSTATKTEAASSDPIALAAAAMKNLFESSSSATTSLANITNHPTTSTIISALLQSGNAAAAAATSSASSALPQTIPAPLPVVSGSGLRQQTSSPPLSRPPRNHDQENSYDQQQENLTAQAPTTTSTNSDEYVSYEDLPALRPRDSTDSLSDSLLIIDGRQYRLAANTARKLHIYYHDHEVLCDTRSKDVYVDKKRVAKMGDPSKEVTLNGRRVRIMYMGQRVEVWIDGMAYQFRADSPPKPISLPSTTLNGVIKRYYVTVDSRTMEMFFNNYRVCQIDPMSTATLSVRLAPDDFEQHEISFVCPPKMIMIDDTPRKMRYDLPVPCIEMPDGYHAIKFDSPTPKSIFIDDLQFVVPFNRSVRIRLNGRAHELAWGGPGFEVIIDGRPYELQFDKSPREILIGMRAYSVCIKGEPPDVKVLGRLPPELLDYQQQSIDASAAAAREISSQNQPPSNNNQFANNTGSSSIQQPAQQPTAPNVQDLVKKLFDYKILQIPGASSSKPSETSTSHPPPPITTVPPPTLNKPPPPIVAAIDEPKTPDLTSFDSELLKIKYPAAIKSLYLGQQCATCGNRFPPQQQNGGATINRYARHLDWHFRQNKKEKLEANKAHSRAWYYSLCEWSLYEELSDEKMPPPSGSAQATGADKNSSSSGAAASSGICTDGIAEEDLVDNGETSENSGTNSGSANSNAQNSNNQTTGGSLSSGGLGIIGNGIRTCPASDDVDDSCCICNDPFEIFWFAEKEEWHFKDAIRVDNKLYHPICFEDAREEEHNNSSINLSRSQSFMDSETTTNATTAAPISPPSPPLNSSDNIDMEHSGLIRNVDNINSDDKLVKVEPL